MKKCIRVWDLEDDYLKMSQVQSALCLLQFWYRKHKKIQRRKMQEASQRRQSEMRARDKMQSDLERLQGKSPVNLVSSARDTAFFRLEEDAIEEEEEYDHELGGSITPINRSGSISSQVESMNMSPSKQRSFKAAKEAADKKVFPNAGKGSGTSFVHVPKKGKGKGKTASFLKKKNGGGGSGRRDSQVRIG